MLTFAAQYIRCWNWGEWFGRDGVMAMKVCRSWVMTTLSWISLDNQRWGGRSCCSEQHEKRLFGHEALDYSTFMAFMSVANTG